MTLKFLALQRAPYIYDISRLKVKLTRYNLDLVGVQEVMWDNGGRVKAGEYNLFNWKGNEKSSIWTDHGSPEGD
jgi:hypothetical protein